MSTYKVIGLMSGTSLDGLDIVYVHFEKAKNERWSFNIIKADCIDYTADFKNKIRTSPKLNAEDFWKFHVELGHFFGKKVAGFIEQHHLNGKVDMVVSHGQTIFHNPKMGYTSQIGCGASVSSECNLPVVCDLRSMDLALGGQGAPLVPVGERYLFPGNNIFLNIGGISNIAFHSEERIVAFDTGPGNTLLNYFAQILGNPYDKNGDIARQGEIIPDLLKLWNSDDFYKKTPPKSLHTDYLIEHFIEPAEQIKVPAEDVLRTAVEHIAFQVGRAFEISGHTNLKEENLFVTGGGALNNFLMEAIQKNIPNKATIPDHDTIQYKEALIIGFLGLLRALGTQNCYHSITGAKTNSIGGALYLPYNFKGWSW